MLSNFETIYVHVNTITRWRIARSACPNVTSQMRARNRYLNCSAKPAAAAEGASFTNGPKNVKFHMSLDRVLSR